jgi:hypothetical protein
MEERFVADMGGQNLLSVAPKGTTFKESFRLADNVLYAGVRGVTELILLPGLINLVRGLSLSLSLCVCLSLFLD